MKPILVLLLWRILSVGSGNLIHFPPLSKEYLFKDVYANPIAGTIISNIIGLNPELRYVGTNSVTLGVQV